MSARDKKLLVYLGALLIIAASYFIVGKPFLDKIDTLTQEKTQLEATLREKQEAYNNQEKYKSGIEDARNEIDEIIARFPGDNTDEKSIMFIHKAENDIPIWVSKIQFAEETQNLVSGGEVQSASDVEAQQLEENIEAAEGNTISDSESTSESVETGQSSKSMLEGLISRDTELGIEFTSKYDEFKEFLAHIRDYEDRIVIKDIEVSYDHPAGLVRGTMVLSQYAVLGEGRELPEVVTEVDKLGTENIFITKDKGNSILDIIADEITDLFNRIMGGLSGEAAEEFAADYFIRVNAVTDNTSGKTIGRTSDIQQTSYLVSDTDGSEDVSFALSGSNGSYKVKYSIGNETKEDTIAKESDQTLYLRIVSTERMSDSDEVAVKLHVINTSDIPLTVVIEGDDETDPRVDVVEKDGEVTVK